MVSHRSAYKVRPARPAVVRALAVVSPQGAVQFATDRAAAWLRDIFGLSGSLKRLPHPLAGWINESARRGQVKPFLVQDGQVRIRVDLLHREGNSICLLLEKTARRRGSAPARGRALTRRESEVLSWVARGKSNAEVAAILQVCTKTIDKHLERIYPKLGVENRTAAASHAQTVPGS